MSGTHPTTFGKLNIDGTEKEPGTRGIWRRKKDANDRIQDARSHVSSTRQGGDSRTRGVPKARDGKAAEPVVAKVEVPILSEQT